MLTKKERTAPVKSLLDRRIPGGLDAFLRDHYVPGVVGYRVLATSINEESGMDITPRYVKQRCLALGLVPPVAVPKPEGDHA